MKKLWSFCLVAMMAVTVSASAADTEHWDKIFPKSNTVTHQKVSFNNRYGINIVADLYMPASRLVIDKFPGVVVTTPIGAVKEQASGFYAQSLAERGFITLAFDPSYQGESGGNPRNLASPETYVEDIISAVDFIMTNSAIDRNNVGILGIGSGAPYAFSATAVDPRLKAIVSVNLYDLSRERQNGLGDGKVSEDLEKDLYANIARRQSEQQNNAKEMVILAPYDVSEQSTDAEKEMYGYYRTPRGQHPRASLAVTRTSDTALISFGPFKNLEMVSPRPLLFVVGENSFARYFSEDVFISAGDPKELQTVPEANYVDLYDKKELIPFDAIEKFFKEYLSMPPQE